MAGKLRIINEIEITWTLTVHKPQGWKWAGDYDTEDEAVEAAQPHLENGLDCNIEASTDQ